MAKDKLKDIIDHSRETSPEEACGILAGSLKQKREVVKVYRMTNTDKSATSFLMDPKEQFKVMKDMRNLELEMVGIYHSHPETVAYPSKTDEKMAFYPDVSYLIVSLKELKRPVARSFMIKNGTITEEELKIV